MTGFILAGVQNVEPAFGDPAANIETSSRLIREAAAAGARLVVLPEAASAGYMFADRADARRNAEPVPDGPVCSAWAALAAELDLWIVAGVTELAGEKVYNAAVLMGPEGHVETSARRTCGTSRRSSTTVRRTAFPSSAPRSATSGSASATTRGSRRPSAARRSAVPICWPFRRTGCPYPGSPRTRR
ncbi:hypothetical protein SHIRM173S_00991 [Streptomyces hirsutus]